MSHRNAIVPSSGCKPTSGRNSPTRASLASDTEARQASARIVVVTDAKKRSFAKIQYATYPLKIQAAGKERASKTGHHPLWLYLLSYGGGVVSGDKVMIDVLVGTAARAVIVSQSTTKVFKAVEGRPRCTRTYTATIGPRALLAFITQPTTPFRSSVYAQDFTLTVKPKGSVCFVDWFTGGRGADQDGLWNFSSFHSKITLNAEGVGVFRDWYRLRGGSSLAKHVRNLNLFCTVILYGPLVADVCNSLLEKFATRAKYTSEDTCDAHEIAASKGVVASCSRAPLPGAVVLRLACINFEAAALFLYEHVGTLAGVLDENPFGELIGPLPAYRHKTMPNKPTLIKLDTSVTTGDVLATALFEPETPHTKCQDQQAPNNAQPTSELDFAVLQLVDSKLPTGGFAHSSGLEAAVALGVVRRGDLVSVTQYVMELMQQQATSQVPFTREACILGAELASTDVSTNIVAAQESLASLDEHVHSTIASEVTRAASVAQGSSLLRTALAAFSHISTAINNIQSGLHKHGHLAVVFGAIAGALGVEPTASARLYLFCVIRNISLAAVRFNAIGPMAAEEMQAKCCAQVPDVLKCAGNISVDDAHMLAPLLSVIEGVHGRLYTRIFAS